MEEANMTLVAAVLVVGLLVGAGTGYYMAPSEPKTQTPPTYNQPQVQPEAKNYATKADLLELTMLVYGAIGASLIAALAAIVSLMQISRRVAG